MIVSYILNSLPQVVSFESAHFWLRIFPNGNEVRVSYALELVDENSPHYDLWEKHSTWLNPFIWTGDVYPCGFLCLVEGIETDDELLQALKDCRDFLEKNGLLENE